MNKLALSAIIVLAGCAATNSRRADSDPRFAQLEQKSRIIAAREKECIDKALTRSRNETADTTALGGVAVPSRLQQENRGRDREVFQCHAIADQQNADIYAHEPDEYRLQAQQEHDRAALMMILTTSRPR